jgi:D-3-phosphoglycerate dehydrogenase
VLITDHPWPDVDVEAAILASAGYELVDGAGLSATPVAMAADTDPVAIMTNWAQVSAAVMAAAPRLAVVARLGVGVDNIDVAAAGARGVVVTRVPDYCVDEVSDHVAGLVLAWARGIPFFDRSMRAGRFEPGARPLRRVRDLTVGIWGAGRLGTASAHKMAALGCAVVLDDHHPGAGGPFRRVGVAELLACADVVSLHLALTPATDRLVDASVLAQMRPGSLLVNTSRGRLVVLDDLLAALDAGRPGSAALDVLPDEPHIPPELARRDDVILTPHVAFSSGASVLDVRRRAAQDVVRVLAGDAPLHPWPPAARPPTA